MLLLRSRLERFPHIDSGRDKKSHIAQTMYQIPPTPHTKERQAHSVEVEHDQNTAIAREPHALQLAHFLALDLCDTYTLYKPFFCRKQGVCHLHTPQKNLRLRVFVQGYAAATVGIDMPT